MVNISQAKAQLSQLVADVQRGEQIVIGRAGQPIAVLSAYSTTSEPRLLGGWRGRQVWIADDFDDPLPMELQSAFEGESESADR